LARRAFEFGIFDFSTSSKQNQQPGMPRGTDNRLLLVLACNSPLPPDLQQVNCGADAYRKQKRRKNY